MAGKQKVSIQEKEQFLREYFQFVKLENPQYTHKTELLKIAYESLNAKLSKNPFIVAKFESSRGLEAFKKLPNSLRGNRVYAWKRDSRIQEIQRWIDQNSRWETEKVTTSKGTEKTTHYSNLLFATLTYQIKDKDNIDQILESWKYFKREFPRFIRKLKRKLPLVGWVACLEAHESGACHCHIIAITKDLLQTWQHYKIEKDKSLTRTDRFDNSINAIFHSCWAYNVDLQACRSAGAGSYITKELGKFNHCENALGKCRERERLAMAGKLTPYEKNRLKLESKEIKKLYTYFFSGIYNMDLLKCSEHLEAVEETLTKEDIEGTADQKQGDLILNRNNTTKYKKYCLTESVKQWEKTKKEIRKLVFKLNYKYVCSVNFSKNFVNKVSSTWFNPYLTLVFPADSEFAPLKKAYEAKLKIEQKRLCK